MNDDYEWRQFVVIKPLISIAAIVTESLGLFCGTSQSFKFANVYLEIFDFIVVSVALYGLITLYVLLEDELKGRRPLAKFLTIKIIVALVFYQNFIFTLLAHYDVLKPTTYWTAHNVRRQPYFLSPFSFNDMAGLMLSITLTLRD